MTNFIKRSIFTILMGKTSILCLENGKVFHGNSFGFEGESIGEIVFNTSMTGYQEILTDPSYHSQIILMTYPHIGNSCSCSTCLTLNYLIKNKVVGISNIDTRELTKIVRNDGAQRCIISSNKTSVDELMTKIKSSPLMKGTDLTLEATCKETYAIQKDTNKKSIFVYI